MPLKPHWIVLILCFYAGLLGGSIWSGHRWRALQAPDLMERDVYGNVYIGVYHTLQLYNARGEWQAAYDLKETLGLERSLAGFGVFPDGDLLLPSRDRSLSAWERNRIFERRDHSDNDQQDVDAPTLQRCQLPAGTCQPLKGFQRKFKHTFRVHIDADSNIFVADTAGHSVYWLDAEGNEIASLRQGLKYPNDVRRIGDTLWIANTNHHELLAVDLSSGHFGDQEHFSILENLTRRSGKTWPSEFETLAGDWYVLIHEDGMDAGTVYRFNAERELVGPLTLQERDPISIASVGDELWVADFRTLRISRYNSGGDFVAYLEDPQLEALLGSQRFAVKHLYWLDRVLWYGFWVMLALGFLLAAWLETRYRQEHPPAAAAPIPVPVKDDGRRKPDPESATVSWIGVSSSHRRLMYFILVVAVLSSVYLVYWGWDITQRHDTLDLKLMLALSIYPLCFIPMSIMVWRQLHAAIAVQGPWLLIRDGRGRTAVGKGHDIKLLAMSILIDGVTLPYKNKNGLIFDSQRFEAEIAPVLAGAEQWDGMRYLKWQWQHRRALLLLTWIPLLFLLAFAIWLQLDS